MGNIISVDGRSASGKTTFIDKLKEELIRVGCYDFFHFSCGEYYRNDLKGKIPDVSVNDSIIKKISELISKNDNIIIDGRTVGLSLLKDEHPIGNKKVIRILMDVAQDDQMKRVSDRGRGRYVEDPCLDAVERDARDQMRGLYMYNADIFDSKNYDMYINTSYDDLSVSISKVMNIININGKVANIVKVHKKNGFKL